MDTKPQTVPTTRAPQPPQGQTPVDHTQAPTIDDDLLKSATADSPVLSFDDDLLLTSGAYDCGLVLWTAGCLVIALATIF
mmetsp:Transcript_3769/g.5443  ORF Transcript_3769/g.5443 Transcript_3769/m.5443 type:complete len:80 (-) Transcript_3769:66-305(-)